MNEKELEAFIAQIEEYEMIAPPVYLKERMMEEIYGTRTAAKRRRAARIEFLIYSAKIAGAAAAAVFCLLQMPVNMREEGQAAFSENRMEEKIERDVERYRLEKEQLLETVGTEAFENGRKDRFITAAEEVWNKVSGWLGTKPEDSAQE